MTKGRFPGPYWPGGSPPRPRPPRPRPTPPPTPPEVITTPVGGEGELSFGGSSYGGAVPLIFGADKVPTNIIWAGPITTRSVPIDGKIIFYRTVSFCAAFAEGEIDNVLRIWMGDRLIYSAVMEVDENGNPVADADGYVNGYNIDVIDPDSPLFGIEDISAVTELTVFKGDESQIPFGVMVSEEGFQNTPAYRGTAYIMFQNFVISSTNMPEIFVEAAANSASELPRAQAVLPGGSDFTVINTETLMVNPSIQTVYYGGTDGVALEGWVSANSGSLVYESEFEVNTETLSELGNIREYGYSILLPTGKIFLLVNKSGPGYGITIDPDVGYVTDTYGPSDGNTFVDGVPGLLYDIHPFEFGTSEGEPGEYIAAVNSVGHLGIIDIAPRGSQFVQHTLTSGLPTQNVICFQEYNEAHYSEIPTFAFDGLDALGGFIYYAGNSSIISTTSFFLGRIILGEYMPETATLTPTDMLELDLDDLNGQGVQHQLVDMIPDADANILLFIVAAGSDWIVKWNPRQNTIKWKTPVTLANQFFGDFTKQTRARLNGVRYSWISASTNALYTIDLQSGALETTIDSVVTDQSLPANFGKSRQFYDAYEDSITYFSSGAINKVWVGRTGNVSASLQTVVRKLLERVGVTPADINVSDFSLQSLRGYSITSVQPIRAALSDLRKAFTYEVVESNGRFQYISRGGTPTVTIPNARLADVSGGGGYLPRALENDLTQLRKVNLTYKDIDREYRKGVQSVYLPTVKNLGFDSDAALGVTIPVALNAAEAKTIADKLLYAKRVGEETFEFTTGFRYVSIDPGDVVSITISDTVSAVIRITSTKVSADYRVSFQGVLEDPDIYNDDTGLTGSSGRFNWSEFKKPAPIIIPHIMHIPCRDPSEIDSENDGFGNVYYTMLNKQGVGTSPSAYPTQIQYDRDNVRTGPTPSTYPTWGAITGDIESISNWSSPQTNVTIRVKITNENTDFPMASVAGGIADVIDTSSGYKNLAAINEELIQFATATDEGGGVWALTGILRGRLATETYVNERFAGDKFVLITDNAGNIDTKSIMKLELPIVDETGIMSAKLSIITNNPDQRTTYGKWAHMGKKPADVSNVDITFDTSPDAYTMTWPQRTRAPYDYADDGVEDADFVLDESVEEYVVLLSDSVTAIDPEDGSTYLRKENVTAPTYTYSLADQTTDGFDFTTDTLYVAVFQVSTTVGETMYSPRTFSIGPQV